MLLETDGYKPAPGPMQKLQRTPFDREKRQYGKDWPVNGLTMTGLLRLENVQHLLESAIRDHVPGRSPSLIASHKC
jgi:hypothetical protein